jgi:hypothetical protein
MHPAAACRNEKEKHPERFCQHPRCLWRVVTRSGIHMCPKHPACPDCGTLGERRGHQTCQHPTDGG